MPDPLARLEQAAKALLPPGCALGRADPTQSWPLWPGEEAAGMIAKRAAEFSAGRHAARLALAAAGLQPIAIPKAPDRAPVWPEGIAGTITHSRSACLAAVSRDLRGLGLDLETERAFEPELSARIRNAGDQVTGWPAALEGVLIFSAKEAAYKAQYPQSQRIFGFETLEVAITGTDFSARFRAPVPPFQAGDRIQGRITVCEGHVLAASWSPPLENPV